MRVLYASDLDRTLIFSNRFLEAYPSDKEKVIVERYKEYDVSVMDKEVMDKLAELNDNNMVDFVPVTTRDVARYNRINLGVKPEYAIVSNGGTILHNGEPMEEWAEYIKSKFNYQEALDIIMEIESEMESIDGDVKIVDSCYILFKLKHKLLYDQEVLYFMAKYTNWDFVRQGYKCFVIPKHFSKQIALRWLWNKLDKPFIVASGDGELDIPMLTIADKAVIPDHGNIVTEGFVESCTLATGGISSALTTMGYVEEALKK